MSGRSAFLILALGLLTVSCSEKSAPLEAAKESERSESERQPREDEVGEDCVAFVRATKVAATVPGSDCPSCAADGAEVLAFREMKMEQISCSDDTCQASVTIRAVFNQGAGGTITGGLTAWISPEQRLEYSKGHAPAGEQIYRVKIVYKRAGEGWRAIEFDKDDGK
jgi:hypothetical protein